MNVGLGIPGATLYESRFWLMDAQNRFGFVWCPTSGFVACYFAPTERWSLNGPVSFDGAVDWIRSQIPELPLTDDTVEEWRQRIEAASGGTAH